jgi:hypothetical protein
MLSSRCRRFESSFRLRPEQQEVQKEQLFPLDRLPNQHGVISQTTFEIPPDTAVRTSDVGM